MIEADWTFTLWAVLAGLAALGFWGDRTRLGRNVSGLAIVLATGMALSNLGIVPRQAPVYGVVWNYLVPLAIPMLLLKADLRRVVVETRGMLLPFVLGAIGTTMGALLGLWLVPLGEHSAKLAGVFSATYIGGSMNMAAVTQAVNLEPSLATASVAADNVVGVLYLVFLAMAPSLLFLQRWFRTRPADFAENSRPLGDEPDEQLSDVTPLDPLHLGIGVALSFAICAAGQALATAFGVGGYTILFITAISVVVANVFPRQLKRLEGDYEVGLFLMYLFFAAIGISADVVAMISSAVHIALFAAIIIVCHALMIFGLGRLFRTDLMDTVIASNACVAGPATAAALAAGKGRADLVVPAVLLGVFGYAVANFIGVGLANVLG